ncbi:MAG TPA: class II glutamine amidotransferase [Thermoplasmata archaeon]|nr:class II glutamine amidotransferase [Thermoplasmata archaeon]
MCRLFGILSVEAESAEPWLVRSDRSLLAQSNVDPERAQKDGWGIGWFVNGGRPRVEKGTGGAYQDEERPLYLRAAAEARGPLVIGHLRHASNPLRLPQEKLIAIENSQPFENHTTLFAHNGAISFPTEARPFLGVYESRPKGVNDSEVLFWLLYRNTEETGDPLRGYVHSVEDLVRIWEGLRKPAIPPFSGLNVLFTRGPHELWAFCLWTGDHGTGLLDASRRYYEMTYQTAAHRVIVGSEPFDGEKGVWKPLTSGTYLHARRGDHHVDVTVGKIPLPDALEVRPPPS